jgi:hypothetical protein
MNILASHIQGAVALAGGWRKGDRVTPLVVPLPGYMMTWPHPPPWAPTSWAPSGSYVDSSVGKGAVGTVVGPCEDASLADKEQRVIVYFYSKTCCKTTSCYINVLASHICDNFQVGRRPGLRGEA